MALPCGYVRSREDPFVVGDLRCADPFYDMQLSGIKVEHLTEKIYLILRKFHFSTGAREVN